MKLDVWLEGHTVPIGQLLREDTGALSFTYASDASQALSLSLPLRAEPWGDAACRGYFANLLFEGPELERVLDSFRLDRGDIGGLLYHLGADCPGAVSVVPEGSGPVKMPGQFPQDYLELQPERLEQIVHSLHMNKRLPDDAQDPSPVAGVQGKLALVAVSGRWYLPRPGSRAPTTHILKVSPQDDTLITRYETALLHLAERCGLQVAQSQRLTFTVQGRQIEAILSTRFDRHMQEAAEGLRITRVHCEDFCQALGLAPSLKYERNSQNPAHRFSTQGIGQIASVAAVPALFLQSFLEQCLYNLLVGNSDNHAKNSSVLYQNGRVILSPLYDVVPVFMDRRVTHALSFRHGTAEWVEDFTAQDLDRFLADLGYVRPPVKRVLKRLQQMAQIVLKEAQALGGKELADALAAQAEVLEAALKAEFDLPARDFYDRQERDETAPRSGGWGGLI